MTLILIRYGELALKSQRVRRRFEGHLIDGIAKQFERFGMDWLIEQEQGRFFLHTPDEETDRAIFVLQHVPGISSVSPVKDFEITDGLGTIGKMAAEFSRLYLASGMSFGVRARRAGSHPFTSQEAAAFAGEKILEAIPGLKVNLTQPDVTIGLEIRGRKGFLFTESFKG
ncbi:MAG: tRNA 4-thiouridine(8) synthase ThiI, partial [Thermoplasmata archaeon]|nr:tRNA 4-thiouridine(8) synthase ThiI [Thermoplasmata archaeon]